MAEGKSLNDIQDCIQIPQSMKKDRMGPRFRARKTFLHSISMVVMLWQCLPCRLTNCLVFTPLNLQCIFLLHTGRMRHGKLVAKLDTNCQSTQKSLSEYPGHRKPYKDSNNWIVSGSPWVRGRERYDLQEAFLTPPLPPLLLFPFFWVSFVCLFVWFETGSCYAALADLTLYT